MLLTASLLVGSLMSAIPDVIAMDYPPFTDPKSPGYGISFELLAEHTSSSAPQDFRPQFLSPARAELVLRSDDWCMSFFPPRLSVQSGYPFVQLSDEVISIGLVGLKKHAPLRWTALEALRPKTVALLHSRYVDVFRAPFIEADLALVDVESVSQGLQLVLKGRVDLTMFDSVSFERLPYSVKTQMVFSETSLRDVTVGVYLNPTCEAGAKLLRIHDSRDQR